MDTKETKSFNKDNPTSSDNGWIPKLASEKLASRKKTWRRRFRDAWTQIRGIDRDDELSHLKKDMQMDEHMLTVAEVCRRYETSPNLGLLKVQAAGRLKRFGFNRIEPPPLEREWKKFFKKLFRRFSILLWAGSMLCFLSYAIQLVGRDEAQLDNLYLGIVLIGAVFAAGSVQYCQERRTQSLLDSFKKMVPSNVNVWRDGQLCTIASEGLVVGDLVDLQPGNKIPADLRIIVSSGLKVDNSTLTGEAEPQPRDINCTHFNPWETANLAFFPTVVMEGRGRGVVIRTGDDMVMGRIASLAESIVRLETPISKEVLNFIHVVTGVSVFLGVIIFCVALSFGQNWFNAMILLVGLMVANAPESILTTVMVSLCLAAKKMAKKNCVVKHLEAVETLGSISTICADKTGTLTCNKMTVSHVWYSGAMVSLDELSLGNRMDLSDPVVTAVLRVAALCNNAAFIPGEDHLPVAKREVTGGPTDTGLLRFAEMVLGDVEQMRKRNKKVFEVPFNSTNKYKLSIHESEKSDESYMIILLKGAPENVLVMCNTIFLNGQDVPLTDELRNEYIAANSQRASNGERIVGLCDYRLPHDAYPLTYYFNDNYQHPTTGYRLLGLISMADPLRPGVPDAVSRCRRAGIKVIMVTGDHPETARTVARSCGIITVEEDAIKEYGWNSNSDVSESKTEATALVVHGKHLQNMEPSQLDEIVRNHRELVFARTTPQHKLRIVESCQRNGDIVAVTGDGVNDSPALKQGDIGIAMGIAGNDVCKRAADIILLDDNFVSIVFGIEEGRLIFENLKKAIAYTLATNGPELIPFLAFVVLAIPLPLGTIVVLCVDLGTDSWPAISLAYEQAERDLMSMPCRDHKKERLVNRRTLSFTYGMVGMMQTAAGFFAYFVVYGENGFLPQALPGLRDKWMSYGTVVDSYGQEWCYGQRKALERVGYSAFFAAIVIVQWADIIISKNRYNSIVTQPMNWPLNSALIVETCLAFFLLYCPGLNHALYLDGLKFCWWLPALPFALLIFVLDELRRFLMRRRPGGFIERETYY